MDLNGFLIVNKQKGVSSFDIIRKFRKQIEYKVKVGHLGTLDPIAEGVLVLAIGKGLKLVEFLMKAHKEYVFEAKLGYVSDTYDAEGEIVEMIEYNGGGGEIEQVFSSFFEDYYQIPPKYSAKKIKGKKAYDLARRGVDFELKPVLINLMKCELLKYDKKNQIIKGDVFCGSGTYIRSLINDIGKKLKCGAYMTSLLRTKLGIFNLDKAIMMDDQFDINILNKSLISMEYIIDEIFENIINLSDEEFEEIRHGRLINIAYTTDMLAAKYKNKLVSILVFNKTESKYKIYKNLM